MRAAVSRGVDQIAIEELDEPSPRSGEVKLRIEVVGICGSDLSMLRGRLPAPRPIVLGHEGAGTVVEVGEGVETLKVGDRVVCTIVAPCGDCFQCRRGDVALCEKSAVFASGVRDGVTALHKGEEMIYSCAFQGSFADYAIVPEVCAIKVGDIELSKVVSLACGASTGLGAATVRAPVEPGSTVVVYGAGGVGLSVMMGAKANGAARIFAVDINRAKLDTALALGLATHVILAGSDDAVAIVQAETDRRGADFAFDAVGLASTTEEAMRLLRPGGEGVIIGHANSKVEATVDTSHFLRQKRLTGTFGGSIDPHIHIPRFIDMHHRGVIDLGCLLDRSYRLEELPQAFADLEAGRVTRGFVVLD